METRYKVEPEPYGDIVATPAGVRASLDDPERKANPAGLSVTKVIGIQFFYSQCRYNKNLAITNRSRVSCINTNNNTMTLKSGLDVTQCH